MQIKTTRIALLLGACALAAGCIVGARMQVPDGLAGQNDLLEVTGRGQFGRGLLTSEAFDLGPYRVSDVDRNWNKTRGSSRDLWFFEGRKVRTRSVGGFSFSFVAEGETLSGACDTAVLSKGYDFGGWSVSENSQAMGCRCRRGGDVVASLRVVDVKVGSQWSGPLTIGSVEYRLVGTKRLEGNKTNVGPAGYLIGNDGASPVAAVDITQSGRLWLHEALSPADRAAAGCMAAAILLEPEPPSDL